MNPLILVLNGPNLNLLGTREVRIYGRETLADIEAACQSHAQAIGLGIDFRQSNHEGVLVDWIHEARGRAAGIVINAGAYSHTSIALLDALRATDMPVVEVHLSNIQRRETFRHLSYISMAADATICGFGGHGYILALDGILSLIVPAVRNNDIEEA